MDVWFTADSHFNHKRIIRYENRPFKDVEEMNEYIIAQWNSVVKDNDLVFHLGDIFFCNTSLMEDISRKLKGRKILVRGNHDKGISDSKFKRLGFSPYKYYLFENLLLSHRPRHEAAVREMIVQTNVVGNVHGHVHSKIKDLDQNIYKCVSVELNDYIPFHYDEVLFHFGR